ncbi:MAG: 6-carboxytetrahydropterin synthase [Myxococcales bacterium]|nr:6-carboxytetrahydropterin synthase [Myxococcales bacterium]
MYRIQKSIDVSMAHHVRGHTGPCINVHGHTWKLEVGLSAKTLDTQGFVVDFAELRTEVLMPCFRLLDHALAVGAETYAETEEALARLGESLIHSRVLIHGHELASSQPKLILNGAQLHYPGNMKVCVFPFNPTSERLAEWLYGLAEQTVANDRVRVDVARVYETLHPVESVAEFDRR